MSQVPARGPIRSGARLGLKPASPYVGSRKTEAEKAAKRRNKKRKAMRSLVKDFGTVLVSVLGIAATLTVAFITTSNARRQAADDFAHNQQKTAYADFMNGANAVADAEQEFLTSFYRSQADHGAPPADYTNVDKALKRLASLVSTIRLVGSENTRGAADGVVTGAKAYDAAVQLLVMQRFSPKPDYTAEIADANNKSDDFNKLLNSFIDNARGDLRSST
ncbi:hypothetical protein [Mycolicibacterium sp. J2]|uniref:hypothetical protein n=1 Tax=Mycolicibacterium sp. J2 TaxID=2993511 RepID=UPI00224AF29E|nr:hypothetical protein [Mycolicibacterium sp. J2]MCX2716095.1 hypothetical protein [Mycolicibacterium sp. J2]